jgi:hypothetical protein
MVVLFIGFPNWLWIQLEQRMAVFQVLANQKMHHQQEWVYVIILLDTQSYIKSNCIVQMDCSMSQKRPIAFVGRFATANAQVSAWNWMLLQSLGMEWIIFRIVEGVQHHCRRAYPTRGSCVHSWCRHCSSRMVTHCADLFNEAVPNCGTDRLVLTGRFLPRKNAFFDGSKKKNICICWGHASFGFAWTEGIIS